MKQHFLPKCYLKEFANSNGEFYYLNLINSNTYPRKTTPEAVCYNRNYYTIDDGIKSKYPNLKRHDPLEVENAVFSKLENNYNKLIKKIKSKSELDKNEVDLLSNFCIDIKTRNQYWRDNFINRNKDSLIKDVFENVVENIDREQLKSFSESSSEEELDRIISDIRNKLENDIDFEKQLHISSLIARGNGTSAFKTQLCNMLAHFEWTIIEANHNSFFITSDNPGFSVDKDEKIYNTRFADEFHYFLPLTPFYCLMIQNERPDAFFNRYGVKKNKL